jgi:hypothetical protein
MSVSARGADLWFQFALVTWVCAVFVGLLILLIPEARKAVLVSGEGWDVSGAFFQNDRPREREVSRKILNDPRSRFWRSWSLKTKAAKGRVSSPPFYAPRFLAIPYVGYPNADKIELFLECTGNGQRRDIAFGAAHEDWVERTLWLPTNWCPSTAQVVAVSESTRKYIGVGSPVRSSFLSWLKESVFVVTLIHSLTFALIVLPGIAWLLLAAKRINQRIPLILQMIAVAAALGYGLFFISFYSRELGIVVAISLIVSSIFVTIKRHSLVLEVVSSKELSTPLLLTFLVSLFYVLALYSADNGLGSWDANYRFSPAAWSSDNQLGQATAESLYRGTSIFGHFGPWKVSDRPPLLTGMFLVGRPFWEMFLAVGDNERLLYYCYQISGIVIMSFWVAPVWLLLYGLRRTKAEATLGVIAVGTSGFAFFNTIYIWPKMLAGALALCVYIALVQNRMRQESELYLDEVVFAGITGALSVLAHGGVVFGFVGLGLMLLMPAYRLKPRALLLCVSVFVLVLLPWMLWQRLENPPGNALIKFAFAGTFGFGQEHVGVLETIRQAYAKISLRDWLTIRWQALETLVGAHIPNRISWFVTGRTDILGSLRREDFLLVIPSLRVLNVGWIVWLVAVLRAWREGFSPPQWTHPVSVWLALGASGLLINVLVTWSMHIVHHQSYFSLLLLVVGLTAAILSAPRWAGVGLVAAHLLYFVAVWVIGPLQAGGPIRSDIALGWALSAIMLAVMWYRNVLEERAQQTQPGGM